MKKAIFVLLGLLTVDARHLSHYQDQGEEISHYQQNEDQYPSHYFSDDENEQSHQYFDDEDFEREHLQFFGGNSAFTSALQKNSQLSQFIKNPPKNQNDYNKVRTYFTNSFKTNPQFKNQISKDLFSGQYGKLFNDKQKSRLVDYVIQNPNLMFGNANNNKNAIYNFMSKDPQFSKIYNSNRKLFR